MKKTFTIIDPDGLHARPATLLVQIANQYKDEAYIYYNDKKVTLKSILIVMSLGVRHGSTIEIEIIGENELEIIEQMKNMLLEHEVI